MNGPELFDGGREAAQPLARRMRPRVPEEFVGQGHVFGEHSVYRRFAEGGRLYSFLLYGPPGTGKSAFAHLLASKARAFFQILNAVTSNVAEVKEALKSADERLRFHGTRTLLFIDEIHRFNKSQQDALLPAVEEGIVYLVGVTTQNPNFYVNRALASRCHLVEFKSLDRADLSALLSRALADAERGLGALGLSLDPAAEALILRAAEGDARRALNLLELASGADLGGTVITEAGVRACLSGQAAVYDRDQDEHYNVASAFIKSMRGTDPDATLHYLARMIKGGEDPRFIMRRVVICASEDVGLADSGALVAAAAAMQAVQEVGMPEATLIMAHAALRVCLAPKSNSAYLGIQAALADLENNGAPPVPGYLRDTHAAGDKGPGAYRYPHDFPHHWTDQAYLDQPRSFYAPTAQGEEQRIAKWLEFLRSGA